MNTQRTMHEWSDEALLGKAETFFERMQSSTSFPSESGLWSCLALEMLIRACVAKHSPALLADNKNWENVAYALGLPGAQGKFVPRSASTHEVIDRLQRLLPTFTREHANFATSHLERRNVELHSGDLPFENMGSSEWLGPYFAACKALIDALGKSLEDVLGKDEAVHAAREIDAHADQSAKAVLQLVKAHEMTWLAKDQSERNVCATQADTALLRHYGHRSPCPACKCTGMVQGTAVGTANAEIEDDSVVERCTMSPDVFTCIACGLKIVGYSKLRAVGLGDSYISTSRYDPVDYFNVDIDKHYRSMFEDDNNEY